MKLMEEYRYFTNFYFEKLNYLLKYFTQEQIKNLIEKTEYLRKQTEVIEVINNFLSTLEKKDSYLSDISMLLEYHSKMVEIREKVIRNEEESISSNNFSGEKICSFEMDIRIGFVENSLYKIYKEEKSKYIKE